MSIFLILIFAVFNLLCAADIEGDIEIGRVMPDVGAQEERTAVLDGLTSSLSLGGVTPTQPPKQNHAVYVNDLLLFHAKVSATFWPFAHDYLELTSILLQAVVVGDQSCGASKLSLPFLVSAMVCQTLQQYSNKMLPLSSERVLTLTHQYNVNKKKETVEIRSQVDIESGLDVNMTTQTSMQQLALNGGGRVDRSLSLQSSGPSLDVKDVYVNDLLLFHSRCAATFWPFARDYLGMASIFLQAVVIAEQSCGLTKLYLPFLLSSMICVALRQYSEEMVLVCSDRALAYEAQSKKNKAKKE